MSDNNFIKNNAPVIIMGVIVFVAFGKVLNPILELLGLSKDENQQTIDAENSSLNSAFNPNYWRAQSTPLILTNATAATMVNDIWNSVGWLSDDFEKVMSVFKQLKTKSQVSYLAMKFQELKGKDLLTWLVGGSALQYPADRYSASEVAQIVAYVNKLPK